MQQQQPQKAKMLSLSYSLSFCRSHLLKHLRKHVNKHRVQVYDLPVINTQTFCSTCDRTSAGKSLKWVYIVGSRRSRCSRLIEPSKSLIINVLEIPLNIVGFLKDFSMIFGVKFAVFSQVSVRFSIGFNVNYLLFKYLNTFHHNKALK